MQSVKVLSGNELIIQGGLEAGFSLYTGYPGSPLADYFNILYARKKEFEKNGIRVAIGNSEANAAAMASGAKQAGRDVCVAMKSMGLHVASDALSVGNFANPAIPKLDEGSKELLYPGVVIVVGDDPWSQSTSTPADSRYLFKHLHMSFLEPSNPQELKDWMEMALKISKKSSVYQGVLLNTFIAEGGGRVEIREQKIVDGNLVNLDPSSFDLQKNVMVPPNSLIADGVMIKERFPKVKKALEELALDKTYGNPESKVGFISAGVVFESLKEVLEGSNLIEEVKLLKVAASFPLVDSSITSFCQELDYLIVVEEKRGFLEGEIKSLISGNELLKDIKIFGKEFQKSGDGFPSHGGLNPEVIQNKIYEFFQIKNIKLELSLFNTPTIKDITSLPGRLPTFCPGCPHRETLSLLKELRGDLKKKNIDLITHGDVGCYSLSFLAPFKEMHNLSAMGQGGALGAGLDLFTENPSVVLMGDSTFFHSGLTDISNSVQTGHDITYILLDNDNTAMTGHQMTPASGESVEGQTRPKQKMLDVVKSLGVKEAIEINPSDRYFYKNILSDFILDDGVKVIVSTKECGLTFHGRKKKEDAYHLKNEGTLESKTFFQINPDLCENCLACVEMTGCPGLTTTSDAYGQKIAIDPQICVADSYCTKIKACPSFEKIEVLDFHPTKYKTTKQVKTFSGYEIPEVDGISIDEIIKHKSSWRAVVTGVGGSGVTTISRIIAEASKNLSSNEIDFKFMDQKGLAQRNGRVTGHLSLHEKSISQSTVTPIASAELLISPDLLDASAAFRYLKDNGQAVINDTYQVPLSFILGDEEILSNDVKKIIKNHFEKVNLVSAEKYCTQTFGKSVYASAYLLGVCYQRGLLPFNLQQMQEAIKNSIKKVEVSKNLEAFELGRLSIHAPEKMTYLSKNTSNVGDIRRSIEKSFLPWQSTSIILKTFDRYLKRLSEYYPNFSRYYLAQFLHDQIIFDRGRNIDEFVKLAGALSRVDVDDEIKKLCLRQLARTYFIKDEVFCAHQMISPMKTSRDKSSYGLIGKAFKVTRINRPHFDIGPFDIEFDLSPKTWMLWLMRQARVLRFFMPKWHQKEKKINQNVRQEIIEMINSENLNKNRLNQFRKTKGYREVRYEKANAQKVLS
jgi:indolepyruvate ferredoxin oxidoreductase